MIEFIVVGRGLAANTLAHTFHQNEISFKLVGTESLSSCSKVAAGIWNPIVFKRLTKSWLADDLIPYLHTFYTDCEHRLGKKIITQRPIIKPFTEDQEKTLWLKKAKSELENFLDETIYESKTPALQNCKINNGYGVVNNCGNLDVAGFIEASTLLFKAQILDEVFDHQALKILDDKIVYKNTEAKHIIFCEGHLVKENPLFNWIPLKPAKGEILTIQTSSLSLMNSIFNRNGFIMDVAENNYRIGATYEWNELNEDATETGLLELNFKLENMIDGEYTVLKHEAGIRPSSIDRRPIIGSHPVFKNAFVFNGLGTKGVMLAPFFAKNFVNFYLQTEILHPEVDLKRFYTKYDDKK
jgi:glycine oxidase